MHLKLLVLLYIKKEENEIHGHKAPERDFCTMLYSQHITQATGEGIPGFALKEGTLLGFASKCMQLYRNHLGRYPQHKNCERWVQA